MGFRGRLTTGDGRWEEAMVAERRSSGTLQGQRGQTEAMADALANNQSVHDLRRDEVLLKMAWELA